MSATFFPFFCGRDRRQPIGDVVLVIGGDALQPADRDGLAVDAAAAARRLARAIARAPEDAREDVRLAIEDVGIVEPALRDHPDVFRHVGVRRGRPTGSRRRLMVVVRIRRIRPVHDFPGLCRRKRAEGTAGTARSLRGRIGAGRWPASMPRSDGFDPIR